jgi:hypothetical protein
MAWSNNHRRNKQSKAQLIALKLLEMINGDKRIGLSLDEWIRYEEKLTQYIDRLL